MTTRLKETDQSAHCSVKEATPTTLSLSTYKRNIPTTVYLSYYYLLYERKFIFKTESSFVPAVHHFSSVKLFNTEVCRDSAAPSGHLRNSRLGTFKSDKYIKTVKLWMFHISAGGEIKK